MSDFAFFDARTLPVFRAAAACIVPGEPGSPGGDAEPCLQLADRVVSARPEHEQRLLRTFLGALELLPVLRYGRKFSALSQPQQLAVLHWLERNRLVPKLRAGCFGLKNFVLLGYYGHEASFAAIGYPGPRQDAPYYQLRKGESR